MPESSTNYNVKTGLPDPRSLRKLSNSQRKRVLHCLHELVASDNVLKSPCYNATMEASNHLMPFCDVPSVQVVNEAIAARTAGPPGLVVVRNSDPIEGLCLELECLSEMLNVHIVLVSRFGSHTLEATAELRGDLSISGIGPKISEVLLVLVAWSESYGWTELDPSGLDAMKILMGLTFGALVNIFRRSCMWTPSRGIALQVMRTQILKKKSSFQM